MSKFGRSVQANSKAKISVPAESLFPWSGAAVIPSRNPLVHSLLEITVFVYEGIRLELRDPFGSSVWVGYLEAEDAGKYPNE